MAVPLSGTSLWPGKDWAIKDQAGQGQATRSPPAQSKNSPPYTALHLAPTPREPTPGWAQAPSVLRDLTLSQLMQ